VSRPGIADWRALGRDERGSTLLEFGLIAPTFLILLLGCANLGQMLYGKVLLNGAIEAAARSSSTENRDTTAADTMVRKIVGPILPGASYTISRFSYYDYTDVGRMEKFTDGNGNGTCDNGEPYIDENGTGGWDNVRRSGQGGADDVVVYKVVTQYSPLFKIPLMPGQWQQITLTSQTVKKNQPFASQANYSTLTGNCP